MDAKSAKFASKKSRYAHYQKDTQETEKGAVGPPPLLLTSPSLICCFVLDVK
jgi:hypothetical protein